MGEMAEFRAGKFFKSLGGFAAIFHDDEPAWCALSRIRSFLQLHESNTHKSYVSPTAKVHPTAFIKNSYVGDNVQVWEFVTIRDSLIGSDTVIGHCSEVARSIVLRRSSIPRFNYIGSSIVGNTVEFGGICSLATQRFDDLSVFIRDRGRVINTHLPKFGSIIGDSCLIGFAVHCNPGTIVGKGCIIMPHVEVKGIIPSNSIVSPIQRIVVSRKRSLTQLGIADMKLKKYMEQ